MSIDPDLKVLVVEESSSMRNIIRGSLRDLRITNVREADDGDKAIELLEHHEFDLVLCDWKMPTCSGLEVLQAIRANDDLKDLPFIMISAEAQKDNVISAIRQGVSNHIVKPFDSNRLRDKIEMTLAAKSSAWRPHGLRMLRIHPSDLARFSRRPR
jgi:two-component system chemotaxis response regulator CheY